MPFVVFLIFISPRVTPTTVLSGIFQLLSFIFAAGVRDDYLEERDFSCIMLTASAVLPALSDFPCKMLFV